MGTRSEEGAYSPSAHPVSWWLDLKSLAVLIVPLLLFAAAPAHASSVGVTVLNLYFPACPADVVVAIGANNDGWTWVLADANPDAACISADAAIFSGPDALAGGCGAGAMGGAFCLLEGDGAGHFDAVTVCFDDAVWAFCLQGAGDISFVD
jgi:hypothetical protein